jgi:hypothetical protein
MRDACVPRRVDELHVCLLVISLQHLQTLLGDAFDTLLFLLLCIDMIIEYGSTEFDDSVLRGAVGSENLPPMIADNAELFNVLMLRTTLAVTRCLRSFCSVVRTSHRRGLRTRRKSARLRGRREPWVRRSATRARRVRCLSRTWRDLSSIMARSFP